MIDDWEPYAATDHHCLLVIQVFDYANRTPHLSQKRVSNILFLSEKRPVFKCYLVSS